MGFHYHKRVGGRKGWGLNISSSGVSSSYRSKYGSFGSKGFSIKTGIPGLSFRSGWGGGKAKGNAALILFAIMAAIFLFSLSILIAYNVIRFIWWAGRELIFLGMRIYYKSKGLSELPENQAVKTLEAENSEVVS